MSGGGGDDDLTDMRYGLIAARQRELGYCSGYSSVCVDAQKQCLREQLLALAMGRLPCQARRCQRSRCTWTAQHMGRTTTCVKYNASSLAISTAMMMST